MLGIWQRLPVVVRAILAGLTVSAAGIGPWMLFTTANARVVPAIPWAVVAMGVYLWLFWRYLNGEGWPLATAAATRSASEPRRSPPCRARLPRTATGPGCSPGCEVIALTGCRSPSQMRARPCAIQFFRIRSLRPP